MEKIKLSLDEIIEIDLGDNDYVQITKISDKKIRVRFYDGIVLIKPEAGNTLVCDLVHFNERF